MISSNVGLVMSLKVLSSSFLRSPPNMSGDLANPHKVIYKGKLISLKQIVLIEMRLVLSLVKTDISNCSKYLSSLLMKGKPGRSVRTIIGT